MVGIQIGLEFLSELDSIKNTHAHILNETSKPPVNKTHFFIDNYPTNLFHHKLPTFGLCEYKVEGLGCGFN